MLSHHNFWLPGKSQRQKATSNRTIDKLNTPQTLRPLQPIFNMMVVQHQQQKTANQTKKAFNFKWFGSENDEEKIKLIKQTSVTNDLFAEITPAKAKIK